jgi:hypothetical protein
MKLRTFTNAIVMLGILLLCCGFSPATSAQNKEFVFGVELPRQQVEVITRLGSFTAICQNEAILYSTGRAGGMLSLLIEGGEELRFHVVAGQVSFSDGAVTEVRLLLRKDGADPRDEFDLAIVRPAAAPAEECLIYDLVGPNVPSGGGAFTARGIFRNTDTL